MKQFSVAAFAGLLLATITLVTPLDDFNVCGKRKPNGVDHQLVNAAHNESEFGVFPWMITIFTRDPISKQQYLCGGSLIHPRVVLTAAHRIDGLQPEMLLIRGGEWDNNTEYKPFNAQNRSVIEIVKHPAYYKPGIYHDIALLFLNESMNLNEVVRTVCLPPTGTNFDNQKCFVTEVGMKTYKDSEDYQIVTKLEIPVVPSTECDKSLGAYMSDPDFKLDKGILCAGGEGAMTICPDYGGSALVCAIKGSEFYHQAGIVSWGFICSSVLPGLYTQVSHYREWIDQEMQKHQLEISSHVPAI